MAYVTPPPGYRPSPTPYTLPSDDYGYGYQYASAQVGYDPSPQYAYGPPAGPPKGPPPAGPPRGPPPGMEKSASTSKTGWKTAIWALIIFGVFAGGGGGVAYFVASSTAANQGSSTSAPTRAPTFTTGSTISPTPLVTSAPTQLPSVAPPPTSSPTAGIHAWANEIDYDQPGTDIVETIEVAFDSTITANQVDVYVYLDPSGQFSRVTNLGTGLSLDRLGGAVTGINVSFAINSNGISLYLVRYPGGTLENGSGDGLAITIDGVISEFLSYGTKNLTAIEGPANGLTSESIGLSQISSSAKTLQRTGTALFGNEFTWTRDEFATLGLVNFGQTFG